MLGVQGPLQFGSCPNTGLTMDSIKLKKGPLAKTIDEDFITVNQGLVMPQPSTHSRLQLDSPAWMSLG